MLVKFLSFAISLFGTKRYKPLLFTCAALIVSLTAISVVAAMGGGSRDSAANNPARDSHQPRDTINAQTPGKRQTLGEPNTTTNQGDAATNASTSQPDAGSTAPTTRSVTSANLADITLSSSAITLSKKQTQATEITATTADGSILQWSVVIDKSGLQTTPSDPSAATSVVFGFSANNDSPAQIYKATIRATDPTRGTSLTKNITITVTE